MSEFVSGETRSIDVAVIGGGPSGLAAATQLKNRGVSRVVVYERESSAGGIPRHCGHPPFGMREFKRILTGPKYAKKLVKRALDAGVEIHTLTTVVEVKPGGKLLITGSNGMERVGARRIVYATGVRETPRSARLISGTRPQGVLSTGALQSMIFLKGLRPFKRPVIIGTELVAFSGIMSCRHAGITPVAMIEKSAQVSARWPSSIFPRLVGVALKMNTKLVKINGEDQVSSIEVVSDGGVKQQIECDGVIFSGLFTPEASLGLCGHLQIDTATGGPLVDQFGRCSDPTYFATGNLLRPVETAGWSWQEGSAAGDWVADDLQGNLPARENLMEIITRDPLIKYVMPQNIAFGEGNSNICGMKNLQLRFRRPARGVLEIHSGEGIVWQKKMSVLPERRVWIELNKFKKTRTLELKFREVP